VTTFAELGLSDVLLDALTRAGLITLTAETFTNAEGKVLPYKKAALTHEGRSDDANELTGVVLPAEFESAPARSRTRKTSGSRASDTNPRGSRRSTDDIPTNLTAGQKQLETTLRAWRKSEAAKTGKPAFIVLSDKVIRNIAIACPRSLTELLTVSGIGPEKSDRFGAEIIAICRAESAPPTELHSTPSTPRAERKPKAGSSPLSPTLFATKVEPNKYASRSEPELLESVQTFHRTRPIAADPTAALTPEQQLLDTQLRAWRKSESERIGLPQFFVLGSSALRSIVLLRPKTLTQLKTIEGIGPDKAEKFGTSILELCGA